MIFFQVLDEIGVDVASQVCFVFVIMFFSLLNLINCDFPFFFFKFSFGIVFVRPWQLSAAPKGKIAGKNAEDASRYVFISHTCSHAIFISML